MFLRAAWHIILDGLYGRDLMLSLFQALRDQEPLLKRWAEYMVSKMKEATATGEAVNMVAYYNFTT